MVSPARQAYSLIFYFLPTLFFTRLSLLFAADMKVTQRNFNFAKKQGLPLYFVSAADGTNVVKVRMDNTDLLNYTSYTLSVYCIPMLNKKKGNKSSVF